MPCTARALIVAGPTASGKSALALALAERLRGTVINADSMQVYRELRIITARPTPEEEARVPHRLYGVRPAAEAGSVAWWRAAALAAMAEARQAGRLPILTGGSGMYFLSLTEGLAEIPDPGPAARAEARALLAERGAARAARPAGRSRPRHRRPPASRGQPARRPRLGGLARHRRRPCRLAAAARPARRHGGSPPCCSTRRGRNCAPRSPRRFAAMLQHGRSRGSAARCWRCGLDPALPAMRAHGVPELAAWLRGRDRAGGGAAAAHRTGDRPVHQAAGDLVPASCAGAHRSARIRSMRESQA